MHELLDRQLRVGVGVTESCGELALMIEQQAVFPAVGDDVQPEANAPQKVAAFLEPLAFLMREESQPRQLTGFGRAQVSPGDPADRLYVTQPTR